MRLKISFLLFAIFVSVYSTNVFGETADNFQDIEIYTLKDNFYARGKSDLKILFKSPNARECIQFAINQFDSLGGLITLCRGDYMLDAPLILNNRINVQGSGRSSRLIITPENKEGIGISCVDKRGIIISDICVTAKNNTYAKSGIVIDGSGECKVRDCFVIGFSEYGINLKNNSYLCQITGCSLAGNDKANIYLESLTKGGKYGNFIPNLVTECMIYGGGYGIETKNAIVCHIIGCMIVQSKGAGIYLHDISNSILISGVRTFQVQGHGILVENTDEFNLTGNIISWHTKNGVLIKNSRWGTITGNEIIDNSSYNSGTADGKTPENVAAVSNDTIPLYNGISLHKVRGYSVTGNTVFNWPVCMPMKYGIYEDSLSFRNAISANHVNYTTEEGVVSKGIESVSANNAIYEIGPMRHEDNPHYDKEFKSWWAQSFQTELIDLLIEIQK